MNLDNLYSKNLHLDTQDFQSKIAQGKYSSLNHLIIDFDKVKDNVVISAQSSLWNKTLKLLENQLEDYDFNTWIQPLKVLSLDVQKSSVALIILVPNEYVKHRIENQFLHGMKQELASLRPDNAPKIFISMKYSDAALSLEALIKDAPVQNKPITQRQPIQKAIIKKPNPTLALAAATDVDDSLFSVQKTAPKTDKKQNINFLKKKAGIKNALTFDSLIEGTANQFAIAAGKQIIEQTDKCNFNPILFYGDSGLGKTHLLHSIGNGILDKNPQKKVKYVTSQEFVESLVNSFKPNKSYSIEDFKETYLSLDMILLDDVQFFIGKDKSQEELFNIFNFLIENDKQIILTCDQLAQELEGIENRLKSRFMSGLSVRVEQPELEMRVAIIMQKAVSEGVFIPEEVAFLIAENLSSNIRQLEGAVNKIISYSKFRKTAITLNTAKEGLKDLLQVKFKQISISNIQKISASYYRIKTQTLLSKKRTKNIARPRQLAMYLIKNLTNHSYPEIGEAFGGRDHTTVLHACRTIARLIKDGDTNLGNDYEELKKIILSS